MHLDLHVIKSFPLANLNRGEYGELKTFEFGDAQRQYISSQCLRHNQRNALAGHGLVPAIRTAMLLDRLVGDLERMGRDADAARLVVRSGLGAIGFGFQEDHPELTQYLLFLGEDEIEAMAQVLHRAEVWDALWAAAPNPTATKKATRSATETREARTALMEALARGSRSAAKALFGAMFADVPNMNVDGAVSTAHAFTTHPIIAEEDFFSAIDDLASPEQAGAAYISTSQQFAAGTFYQYSTVNAGSLLANLGGSIDLARRTLAAYIAATVTATPTGKRSATAPYTPASLAVVSLRDEPWNLANAFCRSVRAREANGDLIAASVARLDEHYGELMGMYGKTGEHGLWMAGMANADMQHLTAMRMSLSLLIEQAVLHALPA